jgi:hypothetical protein
MPCKECDAPEESMKHILLECNVSGQGPAWAEARSLWEKTGLEWPVIMMGLVYGLGLYEIRNRRGMKDQGATRLFQIIVSETLYLIWLLRCRWRIEDESNLMKTPQRTVIIDRWRHAISRRLQYDKILTKKEVFGKKALDVDTV